jgi:HSP20 family protein
MHIGKREVSAMAIRDLVPWRRQRQVPVRWESERPWLSFQREMDRLFDEFSRGWGTTLPARFGEEWGVFSPRVDVREGDDEIQVSAELPGLDADDVDVGISNDLLTISGEKKEETEERGENYYHAERSYGSFRRSIPLPAEVDADKVEAVFEKGVLTVTLPKIAGAETRKRIAVKSR